MQQQQQRAHSLTGLLAFLSLLFVCPQLHAGTVQRNYATSAVLQIGNDAQPVASVEGGDVRGQIVTEPGGNKHIGGMTIDPIRAQVRPGDFAGFISKALGGGDPGGARTDGAVLFIDFDRKVQARREFKNAMLTEFTIPALSAASKEAPHFTIALQPESVQDGKGDGSAAKTDFDSKAKKWTGQFRMRIPGLEMSRVSKVDAITLRRAVAGGATGVERIEKSQAGNWQISNIVFTIAEQDAEPFRQWLEQLVVKGGGDNLEKTLDIDLLDPTMKTALLTVHFDGVGIVSAAREAVNATKADTAPAGLRVEVYAERMMLPDAKSAAAGGSSTPDSAPPPPAGATAAAPAAIEKPATAPVAPAPTRVRLRPR